MPIGINCRKSSTNELRYLAATLPSQHCYRQAAAIALQSGSHGRRMLGHRGSPRSPWPALSPIPRISVACSRRRRTARPETIAAVCSSLRSRNRRSPELSTSLLVALQQDPPALARAHILRFAPMRISSSTQDESSYPRWLGKLRSQTPFCRSQTGGYDPSARFSLRSYENGTGGRDASLRYAARAIGPRRGCVSQRPRH